MDKERNIKLLNKLKKISSGELKKNIIMLDSQYKENNFRIDDLEELISNNFESFSSDFNELSNQNNISLKLMLSPLEKNKFIIVDDEELYKESQTDSTQSLDQKEFVSLYGKKEEKIKLFVSYSHKDSEYVENLINELEKALPLLEFWKDNEKLISGDKFKKDISSAITEYDYGLLMVSENFESEFIIEHELPYYVEVPSS